MEENEEKKNEEGITNFKRKFKLHKVCGDDGDKFSQIWFYNGHAYASNGHCAIRADIGSISTYSIAEVMMLEGKHICGEVFAKILTHENVNITDEGFDADVENGNGILYRFSKDNEEVKMPDIDALIANAKKGEKTTNTNVLGYNIEYLNQLCDAMGTKKVKLRVKDADKAIIVEPLGVDLDIVGIFMPMMVDKE